MHFFFSSLLLWALRTFFALSFKPFMCVILLFAAAVAGDSVLLLLFVCAGYFCFVLFIRLVNVLLLGNLC